MSTFDPSGYDDSTDFLTKGELRTEAQRLQQQQMQEALQRDYLSRYPQDTGATGLLHSIASEMPRDEFNKKVLDPAARAELWDTIHTEAAKRAERILTPPERPISLNASDHEPDEETRAQSMQDDIERNARTRRPLR